MEMKGDKIMKNIDDMNIDELMKLVNDGSFNEEVSALVICGYSIDNAIQTALERRISE